MSHHQFPSHLKALFIAEKSCNATIRQLAIKTFKEPFNYISQKCFNFNAYESLHCIPSWKWFTWMQGMRHHDWTFSPQWQLGWASLLWRDQNKVHTLPKQKLKSSNIIKHRKYTCSLWSGCRYTTHYSSYIYISNSCMFLYWVWKFCI